MFELEYKTKASSGWNNARKAHLFICMDHPLPTAKLMAALHWMDSRYAHIVIDIADTLKRYYHLHLGASANSSAGITG